MSILAIDVDEAVQISLPLEVALDNGRLKEVLTVLSEILGEYKEKRLDHREALKAFRSKYKASRPVVEILERSLTTIMKLVDASEDSVWIFMMRNIYAPLRMKKRRFDLLVGNPPWVSFKFMEDSSYQSFIKETVFVRQYARKQSIDQNQCSFVSFLIQQWIVTLILS